MSGATLEVSISDEKILITSFDVFKHHLANWVICFNCEHLVFQTGYNSVAKAAALCLFYSQLSLPFLILFYIQELHYYAILLLHGGITLPLLAIICQLLCGCK